MKTKQIFLLLLCLFVAGTQLSAKKKKSKYFILNPNELAFIQIDSLIEKLNINVSEMNWNDENGNTSFSYHIKNYKHKGSSGGIDFGFNDQTYKIHLKFEFNENERLKYIEMYALGSGPTPTYYDKMKKQQVAMFGKFDELYGEAQKVDFTNNGSIDQLNWYKKDEFIVKIKTALDNSEKKDYYTALSISKIYFYERELEDLKLNEAINIGVSYNKLMTENNKDSAMQLAYSVFKAFENPKYSTPNYGEYTPHVNSILNNNKLKLYVKSNDNAKCYINKPNGYVIDNFYNGLAQDNYYYTYKDLKDTKNGSVVKIFTSDITPEKRDTANYPRQYGLFYGGIYIYFRQNKEYMITQRDFNKKINDTLVNWSTIPNLNKDNKSIVTTVYLSNERVNVSINNSEFTEFTGAKDKGKNNRLMFLAWEGTCLSIDKIVALKYEPEMLEAVEKMADDLFIKTLNKPEKNEFDWQLIYNYIIKTRYTPKKQQDILNTVSSYLNNNSIENYGVPEYYFTIHGYWETLYKVQKNIDAITQQKNKALVNAYLNELLAIYAKNENRTIKGKLRKYLTNLYEAYHFYPSFSYLFTDQSAYAWDKALTPKVRKAVAEKLAEQYNTPWGKEQEGFLKVILGY